MAVALRDRLDNLPNARESVSERAILYGVVYSVAQQPVAAISALEPRRKSLSPVGLDTLARAYMAQGRRGPADAIVRELKAQGYAHPGFLAFWKESPLAGTKGLGD